jgi:prophage regulatory protein
MNIPDDEQVPVRLVTFPEFEPRKGIPFTRQYIDRLESEGRFPTRVRTGLNSVAWIEHELDAWIKALPRGKIRGRRNATRQREDLDAEQQRSDVRLPMQPERKGGAGRSPCGGDPRPPERRKARRDAESGIQT